MAKLDRFAPAMIRRAFFIFSLTVGVLRAAAPLPAPPELAQLAPPTAAETAQILAQFRQTGVQGDYYLEFELRAMPRRGNEAVWAGKMWGSRNSDGAITRVALSETTSRDLYLLVQNGPQPAVWRSADGKITQLDVAALFQPLVPGANLSAFDLQMPFLYWPDPFFEKVTRKRGRPAHVFVFRPPTAFAAKYPALGGVRVYLDTQYNAPMEIEHLNRDARVVKTITLLDLKKVGEQWIPKSFEVRDEVTRDKTRLTVTGVALGQAWPSAVFAPGALAEPATSPATERMVRIAP